MRQEDLARKLEFNDFEQRRNEGIQSYMETPNITLPTIFNMETQFSVTFSGCGWLRRSELDSELLFLKQRHDNTASVIVKKHRRNEAVTVRTPAFLRNHANFI